MASGESGTERSEGVFFRRHHGGRFYLDIPFLCVAVCNPETSHLGYPCSSVAQDDEERISYGIIFEDCLDVFYLYITQGMSICIGAPCTFNQEAGKRTDTINPSFFDVPVQGRFERVLVSGNRVRCHHRE